MNPEKIDTTPEIKEQLRKKIGIDTGIWFYTKDVKEAYKKAKSNGVEMSEPKKQPWEAMMSEFYDSDHNKYSLLENPEMIF